MIARTAVARGEPIVAKSSMAFVRKRLVGDRPYYQLIESRRVNGRPRQRVLLHLGEYATVAEALEQLPVQIARLRHQSDKWAAGGFHAFAAEYARQAARLKQRLAAVQAVAAAVEAACPTSAPR